MPGSIFFNIAHPCSASACFFLRTRLRLHCLPFRSGEVHCLWCPLSVCVDDSKSTGMLCAMQGPHHQLTRIHAQLANSLQSLCVQLVHHSHCQWMVDTCSTLPDHTSLHASLTHVLLGKTTTPFEPKSFRPAPPQQMPFCAFAYISQHEFLCATLRHRSQSPTIAMCDLPLVCSQSGRLLGGLQALLLCILFTLFPT